MIFTGAYFVGGAAAAYYGGTTYTSVFISVAAGAVTGGVIGEIVFPVLGVGDSKEGWRFGETLGAFAGLAGNFGVNSDPFAQDLIRDSSWTDYTKIIKHSPIAIKGSALEIGYYFFGPAAGWSIHTVGTGIGKKYEN